MQVTVTGGLMWYLERPAADFPGLNRTAVLSFHSALLAGSAVNIAAHMALAGRRSKLVSFVSAAEKATTLRFLGKRRIDASGLVDHDGFANLLVAFVDNTSARSFFIGHLASDQAYRRLKDNLATDPVCIYGGSRDRNFRLAVLSHAEKRRDGVFCFAPSYSIFTHSRHELIKFAQTADISIMNRDEFGFFSRSLGGTERAVAATRACIVTLASDGAIIYTDRRRSRIASRSGSRQDVIGAGDAFLAGFLGSWLGPAHRDPFRAALAGSAAAAQYVRRYVDQQWG